MRHLLAFRNTIVELDILETCLTGALVFCFFIQLYFILFVHLKLASVKIGPLPEQAQQPLSVIVYARNNMAQLQRCLDAILAQDYPEFELVVVNDRSWDGTDEFLEALAKQHGQLKVVTIAEGDKFIAGKKFAVTMGIKAAKYDWLVLTEATCVPLANTWLLGMQQPQDQNIEMVLGYTPYAKQAGFLNTMVRFETFFAAVNSLSYALIGKAYSGMGGNLAYQKTLFFKRKGFAAHMHIGTGDDSLFVNANATGSNTAICIAKGAQVWAEAPRSWLAYLKAKKAAASARALFKSKHRFLLAFQATVGFFFYALAIALLFLPNTLYIGIGVLVLHLLLRCLVYPRLLNRLNDAGLRWWFPFLDIILLLFMVFNAIVGIFVKK